MLYCAFLGKGFVSNVVKLGQPGGEGRTLEEVRVQLEFYKIFAGHFVL